MKDLRFARAYGATGETLDQMIQTFIIKGAWTRGEKVSRLDLGEVPEVLEPTKCCCGTWAVGEHCPSLALGGDND